MMAAKEHILCVDDEEGILSALRQQLGARFGDEVEIEVASSGNDALELMDELQREAARMTFYAWEEDGRLTGVVGYEPIRDVTLVRHCYVRPDRQRRGIASALMRHVMALTTTDRLLVGTWAAATWAIRFYEKHGFRLLPDGDALLRAASRSSS